MGEFNRGGRPLSPFMLGSAYRFQITSVLSIVHRITGVALALGSVIGVWWFFAAASGPEYYAFVDGIVTSWLGGLVMIGMLVALWYHFCNGVRHLSWDAGYGFDPDVVTKTGVAALVATAALTVITLFAAF